MNSIETLATFLGWCTAINVGVLLLFVLTFSVFHEVFISARFGITREEAPLPSSACFSNTDSPGDPDIAPYIALKIMS